MLRATPALLLLLASSCAPPAPAPETPPPAEPPSKAPPAANETTAATAPAAPTQTATEAAAATRYRKGDYVIYEYSGSALKAPVTLTEEIVAQNGLKLEIQVTAVRGSEKKTWVQVVTDTRENRHSNKMDALYVIEGGKRVQLQNKDNKDAYRLYQWVIPPSDGPFEKKSQAPCTVEVAGQSYELTCTTGQQTVAGKKADVELCDGEAFLWTKASERIRAVDGGEVLYQMTVKEAGRR